MTDPIADMLTRIRNATIARHARVEMPSRVRWKLPLLRRRLHPGVQGARALAGEGAGAAQVFLKYGRAASA